MFILDRIGRFIAVRMGLRLGSWLPRDDSIYGVSQRRDIARQEGDFRSTKSAVAVALRLEELDRDRLPRGVEYIDGADA